MPMFQETDKEIIITEKVPNRARIFLFLVGLFPIFITPYDLLIRPHWQGFSVYLILPILISIGAVLVGLAFIAAGLYGLDTTFQFLKETKTIHYSYQAALIPLRKKTFKFSDIITIEIKTHNWSDGPSTYGLEFIFRNKEKIETASFEKREEAEWYLDRIRQVIS